MGQQMQKPGSGRVGGTQRRGLQKLAYPRCDVNRKGATVEAAGRDPLSKGTAADGLQRQHLHRIFTIIVTPQRASKLPHVV